MRSASATKALIEPTPERRSPASISTRTLISAPLGHPAAGSSSALISLSTESMKSVPPVHAWPMPDVALP
jgi:hypothetical protein